MPSTTRTVYQPLHPDIRSKLSREYVQLHDEVLQYIEPSEKRPWSASRRNEPSPIAAFQQKPVEVGNVEEREISSYQIRIFTPAGEAPTGGWPGLLWYHGGGWTMGGLGSENGFLRHVCRYTRCVVVTVNYRHAPEHMYPTAIDDAVDALLWLQEGAGAKIVNVDRSRVAIGGLSAGGQLAASTALRGVELGLKYAPIFQLLISPVIDSTASISGVWSESQHSPWLTPARMQWYRSKYFGDSGREKEWLASPNYAPSDLLARLPPTFLAIADCDLLAPEQMLFAEKLETCGVAVNKRVHEGATHSMLSLAGAHETGKCLVHGACEALAAALSTSYSRECSPIVSAAG